MKKRNSLLIEQCFHVVENLYDNDWETIDGRDLEQQKKGFLRIAQAENHILVQMSELVITADFLRFSSGRLDELIILLNQKRVELLPDAPSYDLLKKYNGFLDSMNMAVLLLKQHSDMVKQCFSTQKDGKEIINFIWFDKQERVPNWLDTFNIVLDVCLSEYRFTYNKESIRKLIVNKERLRKIKSTTSVNEIEKMISNVIEKIDFMLLKLSHFAKDKSIEYLINYEKTIVRPSEEENTTESLYSRFLKFIEPDKYITPVELLEWQKHRGRKWPTMWQMVLLMRYYTTISKDVTQATNLLKVYETFYLAMKNQNTYVLNEYSFRSVRVYMYNCVLSLKCKSDNYSYDELRNDMDNIKTVQNECMIYSYHPYQKALDYVITDLTNDLRMGEKRKETLAKKFDFVRKVQAVYEDNVKWCKSHQCYAFQLAMRDCTLLTNKDNVLKKVFFPSSFSRPLKFDEIDSKSLEMKSKISFLENEIENYDKVLSIKDAQNKISNMEKKNMKMMGLFVTVTTFLVGLLSIFIGNTGTVSIFQRMEYVIVLGILLLLFVCLGYFVVSDNKNKFKSICIGTLLVTLSCVLVVFYASRKNTNLIDRNNDNVGDALSCTCADCDSIKKVDTLEGKTH